MDTEYLDKVAPTRGLPAGLVFVDAAAASLLAWLDARGLGDWQIYQTDLDVNELIRHAPDQPPTWEPLDALTGHAGNVARLIENGEALDVYPSGACLLEPHAIAVGRWFYIEPFNTHRKSLVLLAAPNADDVARATAVVRARLHDGGKPTWQVVRASFVDDEPLPRTPIEPDSIVVAPALAERVERDLVGFFRPEVAAMYRELGVAHRRGVLMYGPPGNGKTSLIRAVGGRLPGVAALLLRAGDAFGGEDLEYAIDLWTKQAPAMLVIEDLNWLLEKINVSVFLNLLDGINTPKTARGGLLLIASTNHPQKLDAALSNRPGRFDVTIEVAPPDRATRAAYFKRFLSRFGEAFADEVADATDELSFAHCAEVLRLAGLLAINDGRSERSTADVRAAIAIVQSGRHDADTGFRPPAPRFGLQTLVRKPV